MDLTGDWRGVALELEVYYVREFVDKYKEDGRIIFLWRGGGEGNISGRMGGNKTTGLW